MTPYFRLTLEVNIQGAWYLSTVVDGKGREVLGSYFNQGKYFERATKLTVIPNVIGKPVDFRETSFGVPVVSNTFANVVAGFDPQAIQLIPVTVAPSITGYAVLNILAMLDCIDHEHTDIGYYTEKDDVLEVIGKIKLIRNLTIRSEIVEGHHIFRLAQRWNIIVVSEVLKRALEESRFTGMKFIPIDNVDS